MKKLYVTDLDGTLLNSRMQLSRYTIDTLNRLIQNNLMITYSTARSFYTTSKLLNQVQFQLPCITYNGVYVLDAKTGEVFRKNGLERSVFQEVMDIAKKLKLKPFAFGKTVLGEEKLLYEQEENLAHIQFIEERKKRNDNLVDIQRLFNILSVMNEQQIRLDSAVSRINSEGIVRQKTLNKEYLKELNIFLSDVHAVYGEFNFEWRTKED